ncbi:hypothetical protein [Jongsikchunia kroppenstedtii]|uniref:hypothetical protein n=1 Tax=Jongsikchunia kroppenstedtii TaxID=1121721 RepID=UPI0003695AD7|nr:hypothetical protein [Jongsikchunia kroppenstedtii]
MNTYVVTIDQRGSRRDVDRVDELLRHLSQNTTPLRAFERTAGDEVQGVFDDASDVVAAALGIAETFPGGWSIGIGIGPTERPLPRQTRAGRGPAFEFARDAVTRAKSARHGLAVAGSSTAACRDAQTALTLVIGLLTGRSTTGQDAVAAMRTGITQAAAAAALGITPQAMSQRLRTAGWDIEDDARLLAAHTLAAAAHSTDDASEGSPR